MKLQQTRIRRASAASAGGFTLVETMVAVMLGAIMLSSLYACFASGWAVERVTSEDLRATQILVQRLERVRLCSFQQVTDPNYNPRTSSESYNPSGEARGAGGVVYTITFDPSVPAPGTLPESYRTNMLLVTATATWPSGGVQRSRSMQTWVARSGIQGYVVAGQ
jgi:prepilin-type N-terminal cleavage/methylation domain-containing protein